MKMLILILQKKDYKELQMLKKMKIKKKKFFVGVFLSFRNLWNRKHDLKFLPDFD